MSAFGGKLSVFFDENRRLNAPERFGAPQVFSEHFVPREIPSGDRFVVQCLPSVRRPY
jgi:hypothetical protein